MEIDKKSWHTRVYLWWYNHKYKVPSWRQPQKVSSNLCPYVRAVIFWAPLRFIFWNWVKLVEWGEYDTNYISLNMLTIPFMILTFPPLAGFVSYNLKMLLWLVGAVTTGCFLVVLIIVLFVSVIDHLKERAYQRRLQRGDDPYVAPKPKKPSKCLKFFELIHHYLRSGHDRICPELQFVDQPDEPTNLPPADSGVLLVDEAAILPNAIG